jgi:hypothetical protein
VCAVLAYTTLAFAPSANAQPLPTLHIHGFALALDRTSVNVGEAFHLTLKTHVDEKLSALDNVVLPNLSGLEDLGDERRCTPSKKGTDCIETLTLDAADPGDRTIGPASLEAIDPRTGRPHNIQSNVVTIHVTGQSKTSNEPPAPDFFGDIVAAAVRGVITFVLVAVAVWALLWGFGRRRARPSPVPLVATPAPPPPPPTAAVDWAAQLAALTAALEREPTRANAVAVREALRRHVGARDEETLADLVARNATNGQLSTLVALTAIERAAFCEEERVPEAAREALPYLKS